MGMCGLWSTAEPSQKEEEKCKEGKNGESKNREQRRGKESRLLLEDDDLDNYG